MTVDCTNCYVVGEDFDRAGALRLDPADLDTPSDELVLGLVSSQAPIEFRIDEGSKPGDLIGTTLGTAYVVSARFLAVLRSAGATGWSTYPIRVSGSPELSDQYHGLVVTGRCGPIEDSLSTRTLLPAYAPGLDPMPGLVGMCFEPASWDGSGVFTPEGWMAVCVTADVHEALASAGLIGCRLSLMSEVSRP